MISDHLPNLIGGERERQRQRDRQRQRQRDRQTDRQAGRQTDTTDRERNEICEIKPFLKRMGRRRN